MCDARFRSSNGAIIRCGQPLGTAAAIRLVWQTFTAANTHWLEWKTVGHQRDVAQWRVAGLAFFFTWNIHLARKKRIRPVPNVLLNVCNKVCMVLYMAKSELYTPHNAFRCCRVKFKMKKEASQISIFHFFLSRWGGFGVVQPSLLGSINETGTLTPKCCYVSE